jgi:hypothetical protein
VYAIVHERLAGLVAVLDAGAAAHIVHDVAVVLKDALGPVARGGAKASRRSWCCAHAWPGLRIPAME